MQIAAQRNVRVYPGGSITTPLGFSAGGVHCGIKKKKLDLGWIISEVPATVAGVFTTNTFQAAPLQVTQESIGFEHKIQAVLVNSGVANACTGEQGLRDAYMMRQMFADALGIKEHYVAVTSTGIIGVDLPMNKIKEGICHVYNPENREVSRFEQAILTTDTCVKSVAVELELNGKKVKIGGAAKGSGMIHPNMATMLGFITTDATISHDALSTALSQITNRTFNMITVDGDTSTNDMVLVMANGKAGNKEITVEHPEWPLFLEGLEIVCQSLAKKIARDGEGATKLIEVQVSGAADDTSAQIIGKTVISSNLVKTAIYGSDPNWGRIVSAIGYSGQQVLPKRLKVSFGTITVIENGLPRPFDESIAKDYLSQETITIKVELNLGNGKATAWGCDLTYDYVKINASYRT